MACYRSLSTLGAFEVANGRLLDVIRRLRCFGLSLVRLDLRQEAARHTEVADAVYASLPTSLLYFNNKINNHNNLLNFRTQYLGLGSYEEWDEEKRLAFVTEVLTGRRPLLPRNFPCTPVCPRVNGCHRS